MGKGGGRYTPPPEPEPIAPTQTITAEKVDFRAKELAKKRKGLAASVLVDSDEAKTLLG